MKRDLLAVLLFTLGASPLGARQPVFDLHVHLHHAEKSLAEYRKQATESGLDVTGIGAMWFGGPNQALQGAPDQVRTSNDRLLALVAKNPGVMPIATVHPYDGDAALAELKRVADIGVKVLKIHPHTQRFDASDPRVLALARRAGDLGVIVMMDNANILPGDNQELFNLAIQAQKTTFIFAHLGGMDFRFWNMLALARTAEGVFAENVYFDISGTVVLFADSPLEDEFVWTIRNVGVDRVLLGSDFPQLTLARTLEALDRLGLTDQEKSSIRSGNAARLFGTKPN